MMCNQQMCGELGCQGVAPTIQAGALLSAGELAFFLDDYQRVEVLAGESLALYRELADTNGIAVALDMLGNIAWARSDYGAARTQLGQETFAKEWTLGRTATPEQVLANQTI